MSTGALIAIFPSTGGFFFAALDQIENPTRDDQGKKGKEHIGKGNSVHFDHPVVKVESALAT
jgi:hypothetical protein